MATKKIFATIQEIVSVLFRKDSQLITLKPSTGVTYTSDRTIELPPIDSADTLVGAVSTQNLTNKTFTDNSGWSGTGATKVPTGLTAERPSPVTGQFRFNTTLATIEWYNGTSWDQPAAGGSTASDVTLTNISDGSLTITSVQRKLVSSFTIDTGHTWTVNTGGGRLVAEDVLTVDGTLVINGDSRIF